MPKGSCFPHLPGTPPPPLSFTAAMVATTWDSYGTARATLCGWHSPPGTQVRCVPQAFTCSGAGATCLIWCGNAKGVLHTFLPVGLGNKTAGSDNSRGVLQQGLAGRGRRNLLTVPSGPPPQAGKAACPQLSPHSQPPGRRGDAAILGAWSGPGGRGLGPLREMGQDPQRDTEDPFLRAGLEVKWEPLSLVLI